MMGTQLATLLAEKGRNVYTVRAQATVVEAVREMNEKGIGALLVIDGGLSVGIFTERDVLRRVVDAGRDVASTRVGDVMTGEVMAVDGETTVEQAMTLMTERRFRHLPVVEGGEVAGMVSIGDLTRWMVRTQGREIEALSEYITGGTPLEGQRVRG